MVYNIIYEIGQIRRYFPGEKVPEKERGTYPFIPTSTEGYYDITPPEIVEGTILCPLVRYVHSPREPGFIHLIGKSAMTIITTTTT